MTQTNPEVVVDSKTSVKVNPPSLFDIIFFNDNKTYFAFVVLVLIEFLGKDYETAVKIADFIQKKNRATVATFTYEIAAAKRDEIVAAARANGHPLRVEIEPSGDES
jgi:ATP-dependent Clp protease adaptor protein ClpS